MTDLWSVILLVAVFGTVLGSLAWLGSGARRSRRRGIGEVVMGPFEEIWHPVAHESRIEIHVQDERKVPIPSPGDL